MPAPSSPPGDPAGPPSPPAAPRTTAYVRSQFVFVKVPVNDDPDAPLHQREVQLDEILHAAHIGNVIGWGDSLGEGMFHRARRVAFTRIDLEVLETEAALTVLHAGLVRIGTPPGTEIHYTLGGRDLMDVYGAAGWLQGQPVPQAAGPRVRR